MYKKNLPKIITVKVIYNNFKVYAAESNVSQICKLTCNVVWKRGEKIVFVLFGKL